MTATVIGDAFIDIMVSVKDINPGNTYYRDVHISFGGTANVAVWVSRLGEHVQFFGKIGNDCFGKMFKKNLTRERVTDLTTVSKNYETGKCISLISEIGERTMIASRGANDDLSLSDMKKLMNRISYSDRFYFSGYSLLNEKTSKTIEYLLKTLEGDKEIWFNPGAPNVINRKTIDLINNYVDILLLNKEEATNLTGKNDMGGIMCNLKSYDRLTILTLGSKGCVAIKGNNQVKVPTKIVRNVKDATGAGDAFSAGVISGFEKGFNLKKSLRLGNKTAARVIIKYGAQ